MLLHQRTRQVTQAKIELSEFMRTLEQKFDLTFAEAAHLLAGQIEDTMKYAIRQERHPDDPNKKGDEA